MNKTHNVRGRDPLTNQRRIAFYAVVVTLPFVLLVFFEILLRLLNFGQALPLFVEEGAPAGYLQPNSKIIQRYFPNPSMAPRVSPDTVFFKKQKPEGSYRIFIQGGSTAAGFPYGRWGSLQGMLDQRFKRLYPETNIEIINTAMSAVNTYTLLDFVDEIIAHKPDLVLIYAGHNEYLGVMGAGSIFAGKGGRAATLIYLKLKSLRIYQLIERLFYAVAMPSSDYNSDQRSLMSRVAKGKEIPLNSHLFNLGLEQFDGNLKLILEKYRAANIPVVIGSLVSNEKDQTPFSSVSKVDWMAYSIESISQEDAEYLNKLSSDSPGDWFKRGRLLLANGKESQARAAFRRARDLDSLRFRAPSHFNALIKSKAKETMVYFADVEQKIRNDSQHGIIGKEHMLEHLHPNSRGYFLLAEAFVDTLLENAAAIGLPQPAASISTERAWRDIPITRVADVLGDYKILKLTNDYPFRAERRDTPKIKAVGIDEKYAAKRAGGAQWIPVQQQLLEEYIRVKDYVEAARVASNLSDALIGNAKIAKLAADLYRDQNDMMLATYYLRRAIEYQQDNIAYRLSLAQLYFISNDIDRSLNILDQVLAIDPGNENAAVYKNKLVTLKKERFQ